MKKSASILILFLLFCFFSCEEDNPPHCFEAIENFFVMDIHYYETQTKPGDAFWAADTTYMSFTVEYFGYLQPGGSCDCQQITSYTSTELSEYWKTHMLNNWGHTCSDYTQNNNIFHLSSGDPVFK